MPKFEIEQFELHVMKYHPKHPECRAGGVAFGRHPI